MEHTWELTEGGYSRRWSTEITDDGKIIATYMGSEDFSEDGDGELYLGCLRCGQRKPVSYDSIEWE